MIKDTKFDPKVNPMGVHIADMQRHLQAAGNIVHGSCFGEGTAQEKAENKDALKKRLEALIVSAQAALVVLSTPPPKFESLV